MKVVRGRVHQGRVVVDEPLPEGADVAVVLAASDEAFDLDGEPIAALEASMAEADRGEVAALDDVLNER